MTQYVYFAVAGIGLGILAYLANSRSEARRERIATTLGLSAAGFFLYGLVLSVADVVS